MFCRDDAIKAVILDATMDKWFNIPVSGSQMPQI